MMLTHIPFPNLPIPPSWYPGHMMKFTRMLPGILNRTDVVLEIRDSRLPLTSINRRLEGALERWRLERGFNPADPVRTTKKVRPCEHIVILNKRDLVPEWGMNPFLGAMDRKFPHQRTLFASWQRPKDIKELSNRLIDIAKEHPHSMELNVLVIGMPNVGKSTLLNALRNMGIKGRTPKALRTSAQPGLTQALSTRLKLSLDPLVYAFDSPGVMLPFLGRGQEGAERGVKLALIAGIKEGLYDAETLASYLLYRLNVLNPIAPAYLKLLPEGTPPTTDLYEFLEQLAKRMGMVQRGAELDITRAAAYFVRWWRDEGGLISASEAFQIRNLSAEATRPPVQGWGFDFEWALDKESVGNLDSEATEAAFVQGKMEACIDDYLTKMEKEDEAETFVSDTQVKKQKIAEDKLRRKQKYLNKRK